MTWIVGIAPPFGYSILVSDVCVTFNARGKSSRYVDCLQKIYPIGPSMLGGFSGSVKIGFRLLSALHHQLLPFSKKEGWSLDVVANTWWPRLAKRIFKESEPEEKKLHSKIILAGVHPTKNRGESLWAWSDIYTFTSPDFGPRKAAFNDALAIGSGQLIPNLADLVSSVSNNFSFLNLASMNTEIQARMLAQALSTAITEEKAAGISKLFQVGIALRDQYIIAPHEYTLYPQNGEKLEYKMPKVAKSYSQFLELSKTYGYLPHSCSC